MGASQTIAILTLALVGCSTSPGGQDASADGSNDSAPEAAVVTCTTPGAPCPSGGSCFFAVGSCGAPLGVCSDDSFCADAGTESVCHCDGTQSVVPQCGPGGYALAKAAHFGPCNTDAGPD